jgi:hypothetical protein
VLGGAPKQVGRFVPRALLRFSGGAAVRVGCVAAPPCVDECRGEARTNPPRLFLERPTSFLRDRERRREETSGAHERQPGVRALGPDERVVCRCIEVARTAQLLEELVRVGVLLGEQRVGEGAMP